MKMTNGQTVIQQFESWAPKYLASMPNDPIGLAIGTLNKPVTRVLVTLDVTDAVVNEAIAERCELIIAHHPPIFRKLANLRTDTPAGRLYEKLIKNDIAVYAAHTNLDVATGGVNDLLAEALQLTDVALLEQTHAHYVMKLVVFVPFEAAEAMRQALAKAGAGKLGNYEACSFTTQGEGRFTPGEGALPHIGEIDEATIEAEQRIEVVFTSAHKNRILRAMLQAHPYEEPAYDLYTMPLEAQVNGIGRIGKLEVPMTLQAFAEHVKQTLDVPFVRVVGDLDAHIQKVAVLGGDGNSYVNKAKFAGADVFVTGDMYFHTAQDAEAMGLHIVDPGHHVEKVMIQGVTAKMTALCEAAKLQVTFMPSTMNTEPFKLM